MYTKKLGNYRLVLLSVIFIFMLQLFPQNIALADGISIDDQSNVQSYDSANDLIEYLTGSNSISSLVIGASKNQNRYPNQSEAIGQVIFNYVISPYKIETDNLGNIKLNQMSKLNSKDFMILNNIQDPDAYLSNIHMQAVLDDMFLMIQNARLNATYYEVLLTVSSKYEQEQVYGVTTKKIDFFSQEQYSIVIEGYNGTNHPIVKSIVGNNSKVYGVDNYRAYFVNSNSPSSTSFIFASIDDLNSVQTISLNSNSIESAKILSFPGNVAIFQDDKYGALTYYQSKSYGIGLSEAINIIYRSAFNGPMGVGHNSDISSNSEIPSNSSNITSEISSSSSEIFYSSKPSGEPSSSSNNSHISSSSSTVSFSSSSSSSSSSITSSSTSSNNSNLLSELLRNMSSSNTVASDLAEMSNLMQKEKNELQKLSEQMQNTAQQKTTPGASLNLDDVAETFIVDNDTMKTAALLELTESQNGIVFNTSKENITGDTSVLKYIFIVIAIV